MFAFSSLSEEWAGKVGWEDRGVPLGTRSLPCLRKGTEGREGVEGRAVYMCALERQGLCVCDPALVSREFGHLAGGNPAWLVLGRVLPLLHFAARIPV